MQPKAGYVVGATVYVSGTIGDFFEGQSVVVPDGTPGTLVEFFTSNGQPMARIDVPSSPGQKMLTTHIRDLEDIWSLYPPERRPQPVALFREGDKVEDPANSKAGFVRDVRKSTRAGRHTFEYEIEWLSPRNHEGIYKEDVAKSFVRIVTGWNRLMQPDEY